MDIIHELKYRIHCVKHATHEGYGEKHSLDNFLMKCRSRIKELYRLTKYKQARSIRDNGEIWGQGLDGQWVFWTQLDAKGVTRLSSILQILFGGGWKVTN